MLNQWTRDATLLALLLISLPSYSDLGEQIAATTVDLSARLHYEDVNQPTLTNASGATLSTELKFETPEFHFTQLTLELENVTTLTEKNFSNGVRDQNTSVIADPDATEINQAYVRFSGLPRTIVQLGRQTISLDNERFIGSVDFRQNQQTFDSISLLFKPAAGWTAFYAHLRSANTILGRKATNGRQRQDSDLVNLQYQLTDTSSLSVYHYAIENLSVNTQHDTSGIRFTGSIKDAVLKPGITLEYASQSPENGFKTDYSLAELSLKLSRFQIIVGQENLGAAGSTAFQTPLATLHKFQGFTDQFLTTPSNGLRDRYITFRMNAGPGRVELTSHRFDSDQGNQDFGQEHSIGAWYRLGERASLLLKWAHLDGTQQSGDIRKYWLQLGYDF
jgi:hypothetical protein